MTEAVDGATGWARIMETKFDLIVVDLYIPVLDGLELIKRIRENPDTAAMRILAMSASLIDAKQRSLGAGADYFIQKPLRSAELVFTLNSLLKLDVG